MTGIVSGLKESKASGLGAVSSEYKDEIRRFIGKDLATSFDKEMEKAAQEVVDGQTKAIKELVEEYRIKIRAMVEDEKKTIWAEMEELSKSIVKLGLV
ncbi:hypothetical protein ACFLYR_02250 [Chloroflexota bacterium]